MTVDIVCAVLNGALFLEDFLESLRGQTHADWRLWVRDDGSADASVAMLREAAAADRRIVLLHAGGPPAGVARAFGWLLERLPADAAYVMCADQDDVWLPHKIARTLAVMQSAEARAPAGMPLLVHTDLAVVDRDLRPIHGSFWDLQQLPPEPTTLRRIAVRNVVTGATLMLNRAALELALPIPDGAPLHDWWLALLVAAFGRIEAIREPTILYRQHDDNAVGARDRRLSLGNLAASVSRGLANRDPFRRELLLSTRQAAVFLERYARHLSTDDQRFLREYARLPNRRLLSRKLGLMRFRVLREEGLFKSLGVLWRG